MEKEKENVTAPLCTKAPLSLDTVIPRPAAPTIPSPYSSTRATGDMDIIDVLLHILYTVPSVREPHHAFLKIPMTLIHSTLLHDFEHEFSSRSAFTPREKV